MVIPRYIKEVRLAIKSDERWNKKRASYVRKFGDYLHSNPHLRLKLKTQQTAVIQSMYDYGIRLLEERLLMACARAYPPDLTSSETSDLERNMKDTECRLMDKFLNELETELCPDYDDLPTEQETTERGSHVLHQTLSHHHSDLVSRLDTHGTALLEVLAVNNIITESDEEDICSVDPRPARNRRLLDVLSTSPPYTNMQPFLDFLDQHHHGLGQQVEESMRQLALDPPDHQCAACTVLTMIDPRRIAKTMFERRNIPGIFYQDLISPNISSDKKWKMIRQKGLEEQAIMALKPKFQHYFNMFNGEKDLTCTCKDSEFQFWATTGHGIATSSGRNSRASSFKRWSTKNSRNMDRDEVKEELLRLRNSVDNIGRLFHNPQAQPMEPLPRAASVPDTQWPYQDAGGAVANRFLPHSTFLSHHRWNQPQTIDSDDGKQKTKTKSKSIFKKIKYRFSSRNAHVT